MINITSDMNEEEIFTELHKVDAEALSMLTIFSISCLGEKKNLTPEEVLSYIHFAFNEATEDLDSLEESVKEMHSNKNFSVGDILNFNQNS